MDPLHKVRSDENYSVDCTTAREDLHLQRPGARRQKRKKKGEQKEEFKQSVYPTCISVPAAAGPAELYESPRLSEIPR